MSVSNERIQSAPGVVLPGLSGSDPVEPTKVGATERDGFDVATVRGVRTPLPTEVAAAKRKVIEITRQNTTRTDNVAEVRAQLKPHLAVLADYFANNRPANEVQLTRGAWKNLWYDDPDIDRVGPLVLDRSQIYQVVEDGFYYNVSNSKFRPLGLSLGTVQNYLRGNYEIIDRATADTQGQPRRNVIALEFAGNRLWFGGLPEGADLRKLVERVDGGDKLTIPVPGPRGIQGELWNLYVDEDIRISAGVQKGESLSTQEDLYVLERVQSVA